MLRKPVRLRRPRRKANADELLAPLPSYGTLPPAASWRASTTPDPVTDAEAIVARAFDLLAHEPAPAVNEDELIDGTDPALRARIAGAVACAVSLPTIIGAATPSEAAHFPDRAGFAPVPTARVVLPVGVEAKSPYLEQVSCDPVIKPGVAAFERFVLGTWKRGYSGGAVRACGKGGLSEHKEGRAWDWMLNPNNYEDVVAGQRVVDWLLKDDATNARRVGIMYVIWNRRIWATYRSQDGWRHYAGPDPHYSHIHFSFGWNGAELRTSWWTGRVAPIEYGPCRKYFEDPVPKYGDTINLKPCPKPKHKPVVYPGIPSPAAAKPWFHSNAPIVKPGEGKHRADSYGPASTSDPETDSTPVADPTDVAPTPSNDAGVDRSPAVAPANGPSTPED